MKDLPSRRHTSFRRIVTEGLSVLAMQARQIRTWISKTHLSPLATGAVLITLALVASTAILLGTHKWGIGVLADSTVYIGAAHSLLSSGSLQDMDSIGHPIPLVHVPPLLSSLLAGISALFRIEPLSSARWLNVILFGINTVLLGVSAWRFMNSAWIGIAAGLLTLTSTQMVDVHILTLSEPLYLFLALSALLLLLLYLNDPKSRWLLLAGMATALAFLTRYAGAALVATGFVALLLFHRKDRTLAIRRASLYALVSSAPMAAWLFRNIIFSGSPSDYSTANTFKHMITFRAILDGINTISTWLLPGFVPEALRIAALVAVVLLLSATGFYRRIGGVSKGQLSRWLDSEHIRLPVLYCLFICCNVLLLFLTISLLDETTPLDDRILLPLFGPAILLLLWCLQATWKVRLTSRVWIVPILILGLIFITNSVRSVGHLLTAARSGCGYADKQWRNSILIQQLRSIPREIPVYTTLPSSIRFLTGRPARLLPNTYNSRTEEKNDEYSREISAMYGESRKPGIALVYFKGNHRPFPPENEIKQIMDLHLVATDDAGALYLSRTLLNQVGMNLNQ